MLCALSPSINEKGQIILIATYNVGTIKYSCFLRLRKQRLRVNTNFPNITQLVKWQSWDWSTILWTANQANFFCVLVGELLVGYQRNPFIVAQGTEGNWLEEHRSKSATSFPQGWDPGNEPPSGAIFASLAPCFLRHSVSHCTSLLFSTFLQMPFPWPGIHRLKHNGPVVKQGWLRNLRGPEQN